MSRDAKQEYFVDGMTEDIITELSRYHDLFVIARNSTFVYKGKATGLIQVGRELVVCYIVEGSVRKSGNRVRITVQLIDALDGHHLWAERYDRELEDVFAVQDEITQVIVANLPRRVEAEAEAALVLKSRPKYSIAVALQRAPYALESDRRHQRETMLTAGLPA